MRPNQQKTRWIVGEADLNGEKGVSQMQQKTRHFVPER
jgi:hypothetical protein